MDTLTSYVIYEKKINDNDNKVFNIKIRCICDGIDDAEDNFNKIKKINPDIIMDTTADFHSKFSIYNQRFKH